MSCGINTERTFLYPTSPLTQADITKLAIPPTYPFTINFGPRSVAPTMENYILHDAENNTILYKGANYQLVSMQICNPTHLNITTSTYELALTFVNWFEPVKLVIVLVPISEGAATNNNGTYLKQFVDDSAAHSLSTLFTDASGSFGYNLCLNLHQDNTNNPYNTDVYYFKTGATLNSKTYNALFKGDNRPRDFELLPGGMRGSWQTTIYDTNGEAVYSSLGNLSKKAMVIDTLKTWMSYYSDAPPLSSSTKCPYVPVSQYKCYPFNENGNITTDENGVPVVSPLPLNQAIEKQANKGNSLNLSWESIQMFIWPLLGFIILIIVLAVVFFLVSRATTPPPLKDLPVTGPGTPPTASAPSTGASTAASTAPPPTTTALPH